MAPTRISVAETPVVVLPLIGGTTTLGNASPPLAAVLAVVLPVVAPVAAAVVPVAAVVAVVAAFLLLLHAASTSTATATAPTPRFVNATVIPPVTDGELPPCRTVRPRRAAIKHAQIRFSPRPLEAPRGSAPRKPRRESRAEPRRGTRRGTGPDRAAAPGSGGLATTADAPRSGQLRPAVASEEGGVVTEHEGRVAEGREEDLPPRSLPPEHGGHLHGAACAEHRRVGARGHDGDGVR